MDSTRGFCAVLFYFFTSDLVTLARDIVKITFLLRKQERE